LGWSLTYIFIETGRLPSEVMREGDVFINTVIYQLEQRRKAEEAAAKGKKYNPNVISSDEMEARYG